MNKQEAITIRGEILEKEGSVQLGTITIYGVVRITDILNIIYKHITESEVDL